MVGRPTNNSRGVRGLRSGTTRGGSHRADAASARVDITNKVSQGQAMADGSSSSGVNSNISSNASQVCGLCSSEVGNNAIGCDACPRWFHPSPQCTGLRAAAIDCIQKDGGSGILFKCSVCRCNGTSNSNLPTNSTTISSELNIALAQVFEIVKSLAVNVAQMSKQMTLMLNSQTNSRQQNSSIRAVSDTFSRSDLYVELREYEERKKRVKSIIVNGIQANNDQDFTNQFKNVCEFLINDSPSINDVFCINSDKCIFRVTLEEKEARAAILSSAKNLKNNPLFRRIYISRDLTYMQRQELMLKRSIQRTTGHLAAAASEVPAGVSPSSANLVPITQVSNEGSSSTSNDVEIVNFH